MKVLSTIFLCFCCMTISIAQKKAQTIEIEPPLFLFSPNFNIAIPTADFGRKMNDKLGFGGDLSFLYQLPDRPVLVGIHLGALNYDRERFEFTEIIAGFERDYELRTRTNSLLMHGIVRFQPTSNSFIRPYVEGLLGVNRLFTNTSLIDPEVEEDSTLERFRENSDWVLSYGGSFGLDINLYNDFEVALNLQCTWLKGNPADYYTRIEGAEVVEDPIEVFEITRSAISFWMPKIGVTVRLQD